MTSELLLPVGNYEMALAAIHNGASAIYVGTPGFNARGRSYDHSFDELKEIIDTCHLYGVHVHVALNILIFESEIESVIETVKKVVALSPDALIVQDLGLVKLINEVAPAQVIHGSTQMTITNHEAIDLLNDLDIKRFVVGRENSLEEIKNIKEKSDKELEVFVHGALCVAYSGQCFTSEALGGRSANRGQCAQACRFEYDLYVDGKLKELGADKYLVSPKDLCGIKQIPALVEMGVESFKVEGRLKGSDYVASAARSYRTAIDNYSELNLSDSIKKMSVAYSRGFFPGWLDGVSHQNLVDGEYGSNRGFEIGEVTKIDNNILIVKSNESLELGDGVLVAWFDGKEKKEIGSNIYHVSRSGPSLRVGFGKQFNVDNIPVGAKLYLNARESDSKENKKSFQDKNLMKRVPIIMKVTGSKGTTLKVTATDNTNEVSVESVSLLDSAKSQGLDEASLRKGLGGLTGTPYILNEISLELENSLFVHNKELKSLKREIVQKLNDSRVNKSAPNINEYNKSVLFENTKSEKIQLRLLIRKIEQLIDIQKYLEDQPEQKEFISSIILDYEFGKDYKKSVEVIKELGIHSVIATTRILKPNEYHNFTLIERAAPEGILIRNLGALNFFKEKDYELYGDFSLNVTNSYTFNYLIEKGLNSLCASYDMSNAQLTDMLEYINGDKLEVTIHQYMPEFHMEHCVFAMALSDGNSFRDCGKPCEKHEVHLKDMYGNTHEIKADQECRNTMFSASPQSASPLLPQWIEQGISHFRFEALHETGDILISKIDSYLALLKGELTPIELFKKIRVTEKYGVTTGQLLNKRVYQDRKKTKTP